MVTKAGSRQGVGMGSGQGNDRSECGRGGASMRRRPFGCPVAGHRSATTLAAQDPGRRRARTGSSSTRRKSSTTTTRTPCRPPATSQLNYQGRTLQADRVTYDRNTGRVFAEGNARLTEADGPVITGDRFELTDDFKSGFIDSLRVVQTDDRPARPGDDPLLGAAGRARRGRDDGLRARHLHGLRALQGAPGAPAALAGEGGRASSTTTASGRSTTRTPRSSSPASRSPTCRISGRPTRR